MQTYIGILGFYLTFKRRKILNVVLCSDSWQTYSEMGINWQIYSGMVINTLGFLGYAASFFLATQHCFSGMKVVRRCL